MKEPLPDREEEQRARGIAEQCWLGPLCLLFWVIAILAVVHGCAKGSECTFAWDAYPDAIAYSLFCGDRFVGTVDATATQLTVTLPDGPCEVSLVAVLQNSASRPAALKLAFVTYQDSLDMQAWRNVPGRHIEYLPGKRFHRTKLETPP